MISEAKSYFKIPTLVGIFFILSFSCKHEPTLQEIKGEVFGSYYVIKYYGDLPHEKFQKELDLYFEEFNQELNTYDANSLISKFNDGPKNIKLKISPRFLKALTLANEFYEETQGAFNPALAPIIKLWGFGGGKKRESAPSPDEISQTLKLTNWRKIYWDSKTMEISKAEDQMQIDLNAFAPGMAADEIADLLRSHQITNFLIDISGEFVASGSKPTGPWIVGIEKPSEHYAEGVVEKVKLDNISLATSGNYRQYFNEKGEVRSHIINPRTGISVESPMASVSVITSSAAKADAWSTALMVLGVSGLALAQKNHVKVLFIEKDNNTKFKTFVSDDFKAHLLGNESL